VPDVLCKGKNLIRISAHPTNLLPNSQIIVDVTDSNGNPIYFEIPDYLEQDKSRVISIWIYHDKGDDNTPNGDAIIDIYGIARFDETGNQVPEKYRGKHNLKWSTTINVDRTRDNISPIIFKSTSLPSAALSESIEVYKNSPLNGTDLELTTVSGNGASYFYKGTTPIVKISDNTFNSEMVLFNLQLGNFTTEATPISNNENPINISSYTSSVKSVIDTNTVILNNPFTTEFDDRDGLVHTFTSIESADYTISYFQTSSQSATENQRSFANLTFDGLDPIVGVVNKIKVLIKSDGLPGDYELLNEVTVPFSSSLSIKVPIPSEHLNDPKLLKFQYLNSIGEISRTETILNPYSFEGGNYYFGGRKNLISGSMFISNTLNSGIEMGGVSSGFIRSVGYEGITSASLGKGPGGFIIYSGSDNLVIGEDQLDGVGIELVGDNDDRHLIFTTANGGLLDVKTDKFFIGTSDTQFISGSDGNIEISSSLFHLDPQNNLLVIGADAVINADLTVNSLRTPAVINGAPSTRANSSSSIDSDGFARFVSASIGGWDITTGSIEGGNLIMKPEGTLQTSDFSSGVKGWKISSEGNGTAEFENVRIRGTMATTTFEKETVNAVGGQLYVANSTTLSGSIQTDITTTTTVNGIGTSFPPLSSADLIVGGDTYDVKTRLSSTQLALWDAAQIDTGSFVLNWDYSSSVSYASSGNTLTIGTSSIESVEKSGSFQTSEGMWVDSSTITIDVSNITTNVSSVALFGELNDPTEGSPSGILFDDATDPVAALDVTVVVSEGTATITVDTESWGIDETIFQSGDPSSLFFTNIFENVTTYTPTTSVTSSGALPSLFYHSGSLTVTSPTTQTFDIVSYSADRTRFTIDTPYSSTGSGYQNWSIDYIDTGSYSTGTVYAGTSTSYYTSSISPESTEFVVKNATGFAEDEIITSKKITSTGFSTEYMKVVTSSVFNQSGNDYSGTITVVRGYGSASLSGLDEGDSPFLGNLMSLSQSYEEGQVIVSTGKLNSGYIRINANPNDISTPYIDIAERTGSGVTDVDLKVRIGDLSGLSGTDYVFGSSNPGFGLATDNVYLQGGIKATFGEIGGFGITSTAISSSNDNLILRNNGQITGSSAKFVFEGTSMLDTSTGFSDGKNITRTIPTTTKGESILLHQIPGEQFIGILAQVNQTAGDITASFSRLTETGFDDVYRVSGSWGTPPAGALSVSTIVTFEVDWDDLTGSNVNKFGLFSVTGNNISAGVGNLSVFSYRNFSSLGISGLSNVLPAG